MKDISKVKLNITESKLREPVTIKDIADASICLYKRYGYSIEKIAKKFGSEEEAKQFLKDLKSGKVSLEKKGRKSPIDA